MIKHLQRSKGKKGFTLVELTVVIGIIAVLTVVILVGSLGGNTEEILAANSNARIFFTASQLTLTRAQLTERSIVDYGAETKYIEYKDGVNTLNGKYLFMEARFKEKGIEWLHIDNTLNSLMKRGESDEMTTLEKYLATNINEYVSENADGYFYSMCDENFKVTFAHFCDRRFPTYDDTITLAKYHEQLMVGSGVKLAGNGGVLGSCADKYAIPDTNGEVGKPETGDYAFGLPVPTDANYGKYLS